MSGTDLHFHIARRDGLEFVFSRGRALGYPVHTHVSVYTISVVRRGWVRLLRGTEVNTFSEGRTYTVKPHEAHSPVYGDGFDIVSLCVEKGRFHDTQPEALLGLCQRHAAMLKDRAWLDPLTLQKLLEGVMGIYEDGDPAATATPCGMEDAVNAMDTRFSRFHFIRKFRKETGLTPHQFVIQNRLRTAKKLLAGGCPPAEAALEAGFYDQSHLNRWFAKRLGISPVAYRNSCFFLDS